MDKKKEDCIEELFDVDKRWKSKNLIVKVFRNKKRHKYKYRFSKQKQMSLKIE